MNIKRFLLIFTTVFFLHRLIGATFFLAALSVAWSNGPAFKGFIKAANCWDFPVVLVFKDKMISERYKPGMEPTAVHSLSGATSEGWFGPYPKAEQLLWSALLSSIIALPFSLRKRSSPI